MRKVAAHKKVRFNQGARKNGQKAEKNALVVIEHRKLNTEKKRRVKLWIKSHQHIGVEMDDSMVLRETVRKELHELCRPAAASFFDASSSKLVENGWKAEARQ